MSKPIVSIVTPSFNQAEYIETAVRSVLDQDYPHIEYIVIDGASTDQTIEKLKSFGQSVRWISEKDSGQANAVNKGIRMTGGDIVAWLNSDDAFLPGAISKVVSFFEANPAAEMVYGKCVYVDEADEPIGRFPTEPFDINRLAMFNFIPQPSAFFKRAAFDRVGGLDERLDYSLDFDLWVKIGRSFKTDYLPEYLSSYRLHGDSKTVDFKQAIANSKEALEVVFKHYNWAPANKVYGYCYNMIEPKLSRILANPKPLAILLTLFAATIKYVQMNRGIRAADLKALNWNYIRKVGVSWNELYKTY